MPCFDWLFNMQIPATTDDCVIVRPTSKTFVTGLAQSYDEEFDFEVLGKHMTRVEFNNMMERLNDNLSSQFPCIYCRIAAYVFCPLTFGLSFLCPAQCINDAEESLRHGITRNNRRWLNQRGIDMTLRKQFGTSWIELRIVDKSAALYEAKSPTSSSL